MSTHIKKMSEIELKSSQHSIIDLYNSVQWTMYTKIEEELIRAILNSHLVLGCFVEDRLVGLLRTISDDSSIVYIQDILVLPDFQRKSIGRKLVLECLQNYQHVRTILLLTDNRESQLNFYTSLGFSNTKELQKTPLNTFVKMNGIQLE
jgi:ribosomal protein S18 acetylase RimI-like enzyme